MKKFYNHFEIKLLFQSNHSNHFNHSIVSMSPAEIHYHYIATNLADASESKMFGAKCLKAPNGKALALYWQECMVFKLTGDAASSALSLDGASVFTPAEGRPMNGWIQIPFDYVDQWETFAAQSLAYVREIK